MTIPTTASSVVASGNGTTSVFNFSFIAGTASNIVVTYTDASGNETVLTQGSQYTLTLNAAAAGALWGVGGTVTYPLSGSPIVAGTFLTIQRIVPLTQLTSISNQGDFYPQAVEAALDTLCMEIQQVGNTAAYSLQFNEADTPPFTTLPPAAERAGFLLGFDSGGQPACYTEITSGATVSSAMVPVVEASSTGAALTALGINSAVQPALAESTAAQALAALDGPLPLASIAALRAYTGVATPVLNVEHWFDGDDGGGQGLFWYNASDTTSADNSGTIIIDGSNRRWYRLTNGEPLNILWFGAYPNSSSDSATALNAALAALPTAGGAIYIPAGTYTFGSTITYTMLSDSASLTIIGDGPEVTLLTWAASNGLKVECISAFNSVRIRDMTLLTGAANTYTGIDLTQSATISNPANTAPSDITNVNLRGADAWGGTDYWEVGINVVSVSNINFVNVDITGTNASAYASDGDGIKLAGTSSSIAVVFNFIGCTFNVLGGGITNGTYAQGITISQCNFTGCGVGISVPTSVTGTAQLAVSDSQFNCDTGIYTLSAVTQTMIANNLFIVPQSGNGIQMSDVASATITGNTFGPTSVDNTAGDGIIINSTVSGEPGAVITGNAFWSIPQVGVVLEASASYCNVQSNNYLGCGTNTDNLGSNNTVGGGSA